MPATHGLLHEHALERETVERIISISSMARRHFEALMPANKLSVEDGEALGHIICDNIETEGDFWGTNHEAIVSSAGENALYVLRLQFVKL